MKDAKQWAAANLWAAEANRFDATRQLSLRMDATTASTVVALLQLSLRHPGVKTRSKEIAVDLIDAIRVAFEGFPVMQNIIDLGFIDEG